MQEQGVAMGSPLSPAVANLFMEQFEEKALNAAKKKPKCYFRYVDDTFVVWPHGEEADGKRKLALAKQEFHKKRSLLANNYLSIDTRKRFVETFVCASHVAVKHIP
ncbi:hypothetical protein J437_LFUL016712 [Ladona fulva]|uniref:Reverse transcriptase domain-containing protein n=1 Tax=Ladona fulva TaxID=123851 RepID=A0A8K0KKY8_LADFU|nr:hypothetical protein J437_LFUL016712 [Ladona fulva]